MTITLIIIGSIIALFIIMALIGGSEMVIEKTINIQKPVQEVYDYVRHIKNHDHFSTWNMMDPEMHKEYRGTDGQVGFVYIWDSKKFKNVGAGEQETKILEPNKRIEYEIRFLRPMQSLAKGKFIFNRISENETTVQWGFYSPNKFPMRLMSPIFKKVLGNALVKGLMNLKVLMEK